MTRVALTKVLTYVKQSYLQALAANVLENGAAPPFEVREARERSRNSLVEYQALLQWKGGVSVRERNCESYYME